MKEEQRLMQPMSPGSPMSQKQRKKVYKRYRERLVFQVVLILLICFAVVLERIFYQIIVQWQNDSLASLQNAFKLSEHYNDGSGKEIYEPTGIVTGTGTSFYAFLGYFKVQFLLITHGLITVYVAINAIVASKLLYSTILMIYLLSLAQMFYAGGRPFWQDERVFASNCLRSFDHPSRSVTLFSFFICYAFYCFSSDRQNEPRRFDIKGLLIKIGVAILFIIVQLLNYLLGEQYLVSMALGIVIFAIVFMILVFMNSYVDTIMKKSTVMTQEAKKYSFYWLLYLALAETFAMIVYNSQNNFQDIYQIQNYQYCTEYQKLNIDKFKFDEIIGPWYTFLQTGTIFGLMGAVFGIAYCFRSVKNIDWYRGGLKKRLLRALIANIFIIPSWLVISFLQSDGKDSGFVAKLGINDFIIDGVHFFLLYLWLFGFMPSLVLGKLLRLTNNQTDEYYVVIKEQSEVAP